MQSVKQIIEQLDVAYENLRTGKIDLKDAVEFSNNSGKRLGGHKLRLEAHMFAHKNPNAGKIAGFEE